MRKHRRLFVVALSLLLIIIGFIIGLTSCIREITVNRPSDQPFTKWVSEDGLISFETNKNGAGEGTFKTPDGTIDIYFATGPANVIYILRMEDGENVEQLEWWHGSFKKKNMFVAKVTEQTTYYELGQKIKFYRVDDPPITKTETDQCSDFGNYNAYVKRYLNKETVLFPTEEINGKVTDYRYVYEYVRRGDPMFFINVTIEYDANAWEQELLRIKNAAFASRVSDDQITVYLGNDIPYIGVFEESFFNAGAFQFDIAEVNGKDFKITYFVALCWDKSKKDSIVITAAEKARDILLTVEE